jgi:sigma-E factor negative regulatory protein RseC
VIEETALILSCDGEYASIETQPQGSCGSCASSGVCGTGVFAKVLGQRKTSIKIKNSINAKPGDQVIIGLQESALSKTSMIFYLVPIVSMILIAFVGKQISASLGYLSHDPLEILGGSVGLFAGLWFVRLFAQGMYGDSRYQPVMLRFATSNKVVFATKPTLPA